MAVEVGCKVYAEVIAITQGTDFSQFLYIPEWANEMRFSFVTCDASGNPSPIHCELSWVQLVVTTVANAKILPFKTVLHRDRDGVATTEDFYVGGGGLWEPIPLDPTVEPAQVQRLWFFAEASNLPSGHRATAFVEFRQKGSGEQEESGE